MTEPDANTILLGKLLAETYRIQRKLGIPSADDARIYALRNGFESAIDDELQRIGFVPKEQEKHVMDVLTPLWQDPAKLSDFKGFYDIESKLEAGGIDRSTAISVLKFLNANGQFTDVIERMDTSDSPSECRKFDLDEWDV